MSTVKSSCFRDDVCQPDDNAVVEKGITKNDIRIKYFQSREIFPSRVEGYSLNFSHIHTVASYTSPCHTSQISFIQNFFDTSTSQTTYISPTLVDILPTI